MVAEEAGSPQAGRGELSARSGVPGGKDVVGECMVKEGDRKRVVG